MSNIERTPTRRVIARPVAGSTLTDRRQLARTSRALDSIEQRALTRVAGVQAEAYVQTEKVHGISSVGRECLTNHTMLSKWRDTLAGSDPLLADELRFFTDVARLGMGEMLAHTVDTYCQER